MRRFAQKKSEPGKRVSSGLFGPRIAKPEPDQRELAIHNLQRTIGNQAVLRMLQTPAEEPAGGLTPAASKAAMTSETLADRLPQTRGMGTESAIVLPKSDVADRDGANAVTLGRAVHLSSGISQLEPAEQERVLAHEAVHVAQHSAPGPSASRERLESEARQLSPQVLSGRSVQPQFHADPTTALADDGGPLPNDVIAVRKAKARRPVLLRYKAIYEGSKDTKFETQVAERYNILEARKSLDDTMAERLKASEKHTGTKSREVKEYREAEAKNLASLNRKPISLEVTDTTIRIRARFQVRFEGLTDKEAEKKFPVLKQNLQQGVSDIWNQKLKGAVMPGRTFELIPEIQRVSSTAARDDNFWLITVRPTDESPLVFEKTSLSDAPVKSPTSVTASSLSGGVMSIPPSHIEKPEILGHETIHLFGLVDRYFTDRGGENFQLRDTKGRKDPLGAEEETGDVKGKILEEDLGFILSELDVYPTIPYADVLAELRVVEETIRTGRDPKSMIKRRQDFNDKTIKTAEDLD
jgi:hypothetical protein